MVWSYYLLKKVKTYKSCFRFLCSYLLQWYPFDVQNCQLIFKMKGKSGDFAELGKIVVNILKLLNLS